MYFSICFELNMRFTESKSLYIVCYVATIFTKMRLPLYEVECCVKIFAIFVLAQRVSCCTNKHFTNATEAGDMVHEGKPNRETHDHSQVAAGRTLRSYNILTRWHMLHTLYSDLKVEQYVYMIFSSWHFCPIRPLVALLPDLARYLADG